MAATPAEACRPSSPNDCQRTMLMAIAGVIDRVVLCPCGMTRNAKSTPIFGVQLYSTAGAIANASAAGASWWLGSMSGSATRSAPRTRVAAWYRLLNSSARTQPRVRLYSQETSATDVAPGVAVPWNAASVPYTLTPCTDAVLENPCDTLTRIRRILPLGSQK